MLTNGSLNALHAKHINVNNKEFWYLLMLLDCGLSQYRDDTVFVSLIYLSLIKLTDPLTIFSSGASSLDLRGLQLYLPLLDGGLGYAGLSCNRFDRLTFAQQL